MPKESIETKSVWSEVSSQDGLRILVTRFRGRGLSKDRYDLWLPSLGPSEELLHGFLGGTITWAGFSKEYQQELWADGPVDEKNRTSKNHGQKGLLRLLRYLSRQQRVTLLCHCDEDAEHCHRHLLRKLLLSAKVTL
jgi:uncharacterized protein YeaO (DUF488 family)